MSAPYDIVSRKLGWQDTWGAVTFTARARTIIFLSVLRVIQFDAQDRSSFIVAS